VELVVVRPVSDQVGIRDKHARRLVVRAKNANRLSGLNEQCFVIRQVSERSNDGVECRPTSRGATGAAIDDQLIGLLSDFRIEIVHEHPERSLLMPTFTGDVATTWSANDRDHV